MKNIIEVQKKIIPQAIELMEKRYAVLRQIAISQPIGRRMLANVLNLSERTTRTEVDFLKSQKMIDISVSGMTLTEEGKEVLESLELVMGEVMGISDLEIKLRDLLGIKHVAISKNVNEDRSIIIKGVAELAAKYLISTLASDDIVAISGGSTMRELATSIKEEYSFKDLTVLPTRGSVGSDIDIQANSVAAVLAKKLNSKVEFLYVPDELEGEAKEVIMSIPDIMVTSQHLREADKMVFSFGCADLMARRRGTSEDDINQLLNKGAIGEAFGHYFDKDGNIVMKLNTVGIDMNMYKNSKYPIAVFSGIEKVDAFMALYKLNKNLTLITDEDSAKEILNKINN